MKLLMIKFAPIIILTAVAVMVILGHNRKKYFDWIRLHWFFKKSFSNSCSFIMLLLSFSLLSFSLLDVRGPQKQMEIDVPDQKTIIMIDSSASMLVEDVKPNRFKRSLFMAKHFVKKTIGHQVGVVLFSNIQKKIVPFTDDIDLLNARISGLETLDISRGGSNIGQAIQESLQYFKSSNKDEKNISGNILIFSDSEETDSSFDVNIPAKINVAFVGVGTLNGGKIPLRNRGGGFRGYKRHQREEVISKLNENYIKNLAIGVSNFKYWIASSYSIYTDEIIKFFEKSFLEDLESTHQAVIRPVWSHYIAGVGIIFYILFAILSQLRSFRSWVIVFFWVALGEWGGGRVWADIAMDMEKLKKGRLDKIQRLKLAEKFLEKGEKEKALKLYRENIGGWEGVELPVLLNYGVALFENGKIEEGVEVYNYLYQKIPLEEGAKDAMQNNLMKALKVLEEKENKKKEKESQKQEKEQQGEQKKSGGEEKDKDKDKDKEEQKDGSRREGEEKDKKDAESKNEQEKAPPPSKKNMTGREAFEEKKKNMERQKKTY